MNISNLRINQKARIISVDIPNKKLKRHFLEMGLICGTIIKVLKFAPFGDPISVEVRGYELCIRNEDAKWIKVEVV